MAKLIITEALNRIELVKFFREENSKITLSEAVYYVNNLPFTYDDVSNWYAETMSKKLSSIAQCVIEQDIETPECNMYNININPPEEYIKAMEWYNGLSEEERAHVTSIATWWNRPAVC